MDMPSRDTATSPKLRAYAIIAGTKTGRAIAIDRLDYRSGAFSRIDVDVA